MASFDEFVDANSRVLLRSAWLLTGDWPTAEDLVQVALLRTWQRWDKIETEAPIGYARRVLMNTFVSNQRRRWRNEWPVADVPEPSSPADPLAGNDLRESLKTALATLPPRQRAVVVLRYFHDLSEADAAQTLGCSTGNVKSQASRALSKLRATAGLRSLLEEVRNG